jgi:hypothetical protein
VSSAKKWSRESIYVRPQMQENDVIISSFGRHPFSFRRSASQTNESKGEPGTVGGIIQARINGNKGWDDEGPPTTTEAGTVISTPAVAMGEPMPAPVTESNGGNWDKYRKYVG